MAKYYFYIQTDKNCEYVDIPDEKLTGKTEKEKEDLLLDYHDKWCRNRYYGGWQEVYEQ